jgi:hypothetical protein
MASIGDARAAAAEVIQERGQKLDFDEDVIERAEQLDENDPLVYLGPAYQEIQHAEASIEDATFESDRERERVGGHIERARIETEMAAVGRAEQLLFEAREQAEGGDGDAE